LSSHARGASRRFTAVLDDNAIRNLAAELGVHRSTIFSLLRRAGVQTRYRILNDGNLTVARQKYEAGQSLAVIGAHFGVADRTVLNVFRRAGVPARDPGTNQWSPKPAR
jgi:hypothetical protein